MSGVMQQQEDPGLPHVKSEDVSNSRCAGSFHSALGGFNDVLETRKVDLVIDLNIEKPVKKRKNKKNKKKSKSTKEISDNIVSEMGQTKYGVSDAKPSQQSSKEEVNSPAMNCENCFKNNIPSVGTTSICAVHMNGCTSNTSNCCNGLYMDKRGPKAKQSSPVCLIEVSQESLSSRNLSQCNSCESTNIMPGNSEVSNSCHVGTESNGFKCNNPASQSAVNKIRHQPHIMVGKENRHQVWQKSQRSARVLQKHYKYAEKDVSLLQKNYIDKDISFPSRGLIPSPLITSSRHINTANVVGNRDTKTYTRIHSMVAVESSRCAAQQKLNRNLDQCLSQPIQVSKYEPEVCQELKLNFIPSFKDHSSFKSKKEQKCHGENFLRLQNGEMAQRTCNSQHIVPHGAYYLHSSPASDYAQQSTPQFTKITVPVPGGFQPYSGMRTLVMNNVSRSFHSSTDSEPDRRFNQFNEHTLRKDVAPGKNAKKWVPVGTKGEKTCSVNNCYVNNGDLPLLCKGDGDNHTDGYMINHHASAVLSESKSTSSIACDARKSVESEVLKSESVSKVQNVKRSEVKKAYVQKSEDNKELIIGSGIATKTLSDAHKMQLASESDEFVISCPACPPADFERFLCAATPVIVSSYASENCSICLHDQLSSCFLCKHQIPNTSLGSVWKWYEEPGNYGLKVKTGNSQNLQGMLMESISSHAYFVPYLSAIQLFGYSHPSNSHCSTKYSTKNFDHSGSFISLPVSSSSCKLVFQFFESEEPHLRKPLCNKIADLIDAGTSNLKVFGDPSKLESLKLCDLHPESWFSVAWYPIYRIPDRKFRASFLTYHSLGHLVQRHVPNDSLDEKSFCVVSPVVGMQCYNAKGKGWFELNIPMESSSKEYSLDEQIRTLEENATLIVRDCIYKEDGVKVLKDQTDYEFFRSRSH